MIIKIAKNSFMFLPVNIILVTVVLMLLTPYISLFSEELTFRNVVLWSVLEFIAFEPMEKLLAGICCLLSMVLPAAILENEKIKEGSIELEKKIFCCFFLLLLAIMVLPTALSIPFFPESTDKLAVFFLLMSPFFTLLSFNISLFMSLNSQSKWKSEREDFLREWKQRVKEIQKG